MIANQAKKKNTKGGGGEFQGNLNPWPLCWHDSAPTTEQ